jgi:hypothetical protein
MALSTLKSGKGFMLEPYADELLKLQELDIRYRLYEQHGIPPGNANLVRLSASLGRFLNLNDPDLNSFLDSHNEDAVKTLAKLLKWLSTSSHSGEALARVSKLRPERQEPFINQALAYQALALLARLLRHGEITYHGAFIDLKAGRMAPMNLRSQEERRTKISGKRRRRLTHS